MQVAAGAWVRLERMARAMAKGQVTARLPAPEQARVLALLSGWDLARPAALALAESRERAMAALALAPGLRLQVAVAAAAWASAAQAASVH